MSMAKFNPLPQKVSIIISLYNLEDYVEKCLQSCIRQDYPNLEILVIDDVRQIALLRYVNNMQQRINVFTSLRRKTKVSIWLVKQVLIMPVETLCFSWMQMITYRMIAS